jgi:hypothetical protein
MSKSSFNLESMDCGHFLESSSEATIPECQQLQITVAVMLSPCLNFQQPTTPVLMMST